MIVVLRFLRTVVNMKGKNVHPSRQDVARVLPLFAGVDVSRGVPPTKVREHPDAHLGPRLPSTPSVPTRRLIRPLQR